MADLEVILNLVDNLTPTIETASGSVDNLSSAIDNVSSSIDSIKSDSIENVSNASTMASENVDNIHSAADSAAASVDSINDASGAAADGLAGIDDNSIKDTGTAADDAAAAGEEMAGSFELVESAMAGIVGLGIGAFITKTTDLAGNMEDRWERINLTFGNVSSTAEDMENQYGNAIKKMIDDTGRGKGVILDAMAGMGRAGVKDSTILAQSFDTISAAAFRTGNSIGNVSMNFERAVRSGQLNDRIMKSLGLNMEDMANKTHKSSEQIKEDFKNMTPEARAAFLVQIAGAEETAKANEAYKRSWDHAKDAFERAGQALLRIVGDIILPLVNPILEESTKLLNGAAAALNSINEPIKTAAGVVILLVGGLTMLSIVIGTVNTLLGILGIRTGFAIIMHGAHAAALTVLTTAQWALNIAMDANPIGIIIIAIIALIAGLIYLWQTNEGFRQSVLKLWDAFKSGDWSSAAKQIGDGFQYNSKIIENSLRTAGKQIQIFFEGLPGWIGENATKMLDVGKKFVDWLIKGLKSATTFVGDIIKDLLKPENIGATAQGQATGEKTGDAILAGLIQWWDHNKGQVMELITKILMEILPLILMLIGEIIIIIGLCFLEMGWNAGKYLLDGINSQLMQLGPTIWNWLLQALVMIGNFVISAAVKARTAGSNFINNINLFFAQLPGRVWSWLLNTLNYLAIFVRSAAERARSVGSQIVNNIGSFLSSLPGRMYEWGRNAVQSFINAIINSIPGLRGALNMISSLFPHSQPKKGPLATIKPENSYKFGSNIIENLNKGFKSEPSTLPNFIPLTKPNQTINHEAHVISSKNEINLNITHDFKNIPSKLTRDELLTMFKSMSNNYELINVLIKMLSRAKLNTKTNLGI